MKRRLHISFFNSILPAVAFGVMTGALTSLAVNLYKVCAKYVISWSAQGYHYLGEHLYLVPLVILCLAGPAFLFAYIYKRIPNLRGGGIPTSIGILRGIIPFKWLRNLIGIFLLSLTSFLIGVPLGNEGPSVQMGTSIGRGSVYCFGKKYRAWDRYSMTGGACAGFSVATGAPISGVVFAIEETHQRISPMILIIASTSVISATVTTELVAPILGVSKSLFPSMQLPVLSVKDVWIPIAVGAVIGIFAVLFLNYYRLIFKFFNKKLKKIPHGYRILFVFTLTVALGLISHSFISTGHELILDLFKKDTVWWMLIILLAVRATLTLCANSNRITGGIFLPILAVGTLVSSLLGRVLESAFALDGEYYALILVLGITACISGMMKMPLTAIVFAAEALSCYDNILHVIVVAGVAYVITELFTVESINDRVLDNCIAEINEGKEPTIIDRYFTVQKDVFAIGKQVRDVFWPAGVFILSKKHTKPVDEKDEHSSKAIHEGDVLHIRCTTFDIERTEEELAAVIGAGESVEA